MLLIKSLNGSEDRRQTVFGQHDVTSRFRSICGTVDSNANLRFSKGRSIVHAITCAAKDSQVVLLRACHANHQALILKHLHHLVLVQWLHLGKAVRLENLGSFSGFCTACKGAMRSRASLGGCRQSGVRMSVPRSICRASSFPMLW